MNDWEADSVRIALEAAKNKGEAMSIGTQRRRMAAAVLGVTLLVGGLAGPPSLSAGNIPDLGGVPIHAEWDVFVGPSFEMDVASYVFHGVDAVVPAGFSPLAEEETLFLYLVVNTGPVDLDLFSLDNPDAMPIHAVGTSAIVPTGSDPTTRNDPDVILAGLNLAEYDWTDNPAIGLEPLHPGQWAVSYLRAFGFWQPVDAVLGSAGAGNLVFPIEALPGPAPIPEPATLAFALLGLVGLLLRLKSRA